MQTDSLCYISSWYFLWAPVTMGNVVQRRRPPPTISQTVAQNLKSLAKTDEAQGSEGEMTLEKTSFFNLVHVPTFLGTSRNS